MSTNGHSQKSSQMSFSGFSLPVASAQGKDGLKRQLNTQTGKVNFIAPESGRALPASVLVIEKHPLMRQALCAAIADEPDLSVGMKAANGATALPMLRVIVPDMILLAVGNPGTAEMEALKILRKSLPNTPILALTSNEVVGQEQAALEAGSCAVLTKAVSRAELIKKLREIINDSDLHAGEETKEIHS